MQFDSAYSLLDDLKEMNLMPTASMYNAIMAGYFRKVISVPLYYAQALLFSVF